jgi:hypothetical protein
MFCLHIYRPQWYFSQCLGYFRVLREMAIFAYSMKLLFNFAVCTIVLKFFFLYFNNCWTGFESVQTNVMKTGPDRPVRPVQPEPGPSTGPDRSTKPLVLKTANKPLQTGVNRGEPAKPVNRSRFWLTGRFWPTWKKIAQVFFFFLFFQFFLFLI